MMRRPRRSPLFPYPTFFGPRRTPLVPSTSIWYSFGRELRAGGAIASRRNRLPPSAEVGRRKALAAAASSFFVAAASGRSEEHTSEIQSQPNLVCRLLLARTNTGSGDGVIFHRFLTFHASDKTFPWRSC